MQHLQWTNASKERVVGILPLVLRRSSKMEARHRRTPRWSGRRSRGWRSSQTGSLTHSTKTETDTGVTSRDQSLTRSMNWVVWIKFL